MSKSDYGRRTKINVTFGGTDITASMEPYLAELTYTDNQEDETDDLQLQLQDRDGIWRQSWLTDMVDAAAEDSMRIGAAVVRENWNGDGTDLVLDCGTFELDSVQYSCPPSKVTIKATGLSYSTAARQTLKYKAWEEYYLSGIAKEIAGNAGCTLMFEAGTDPYYARAEQYGQSDIDFLSELCHRAGISLKCFNQMLILFNQSEYEAQSAIQTVTYNDGSYITVDLKTGTASTQYDWCRVYYTDKDGNFYEGYYYEDEEGEQGLEVCMQCSSSSEAEELAEKQLRLYNKFGCTGTITFPGNPNICAGSNLQISDFGYFDGKYSITSSEHRVKPGGDGYKTVASVRKVLEGY